MQVQPPVLSGSATSQLEATLTSLRHHLRESLVAAYLYGSSVTGGLQTHSDLDLLIAVTHPLEFTARQKITAELLHLSAPQVHQDCRPLEVTIVRLADVVPWHYPARCEYQFGEWLRDSLEAGKIPGPRHDPDLAILLTTLRRNNRCLLGPAAIELLDPVPQSDLLQAISDTLPDILAGWHEDVRNALLALSRMWATCVTGDIMSKQDAAAWAIERVPAPHRNVLSRARDDHTGAQKPDWAAQHGEAHRAVRHMHGAIQDALALAAGAHRR